MKKIILIIVFIFIRLLIFSQETDDLYYTPSKSETKSTNETKLGDQIKSVPKGTWKIIVKNSNSKTDNYEFIGKTLIDNNYHFNGNKDFYSISTDPRLSERENMLYRLQIIAKDSSIILTGSYYFDITLESANAIYKFTPIKNIGQKGSAAWQAFNELFRFAKTIAVNQTMEYITN